MCGSSTHQSVKLIQQLGQRSIRRAWFKKIPLLCICLSSALCSKKEKKNKLKFSSRSNLDIRFITSRRSCPALIASILGRLKDHCDAWCSFLRTRSRISLVSAACAPEQLAYWWLHGSVLGVCGAPGPALAEGALKMAFLESHDPLPSQQSGLSGNCRALLASSLKSKVIAVNITERERNHTCGERIVCDVLGKERKHCDWILQNIRPLISVALF